MKRKICMGLALLLAAALLLPVFAQGEPVADGLYSIGVTSSSEMFRITDCVLEVENGRMTARLTLSSKSYGYLFQGTAEEADAAPRDTWLAHSISKDNTHSFRVPVPALDVPVDVAAWSIKYEKWYDRQLTFLSGSLREEEADAPQAAAPVPADGTYRLTATTDSPLLVAVDCVLRVEGGLMAADLTFSQSKYAFLYPGKAKDALQAGDEKRLALVPGSDGQASATIPVQALDAEIPLATWSEKTKKWYDRTLILESTTLLPLKAEDAPSFAFSGGSGRTTIRLKDFDATTGLGTIAFSSSSYTEVKVGEAMFTNQSHGEESTFTLPMVNNGTTDISAQTVAMSKPRWVDYTLYLYTDGRNAQEEAGKGQGESEAQPAGMLPRPEIQGLAYQGDLPLGLAQHVAIRLYADGYRLVQTKNGRNYLIVPQG